MSPRPCLLKVLPPASGAISWEPYLQHMGLGVGAQHLVLGLPFLPVRSPDLAPTVYTKTFGSLGGDVREHSLTSAHLRVHALEWEDRDVSH